MTKQERGVRTRQVLIRSAAEVFEQHGYVQTRLAEVSSHAGLSAGALHFHFRSKAALADAVESAASGSLHRAVREAVQCPANALQRLTDISHVFACLLGRDVVVRAGVQLAHDSNREASVNFHREWQDCVQQLLARAADEGSLAGDVSQEDLATAVVAATMGFLSMSRKNEEWLTGHSLTRFWRLLLPRVATSRVRSSLAPAGTDSVAAVMTPLMQTVPDSFPQPHRPC